MLVERTLLALGFLTVAHAAPRAASSKAQCVAAHEEAQSLRSQKKPHAAKKMFAACARSECPAVLRKECTEQIASADADAPSVALEARDENGMSDADVQVTIDGEVVADRLTGASVDVEPGDHVIRFERKDGKTIEQKVLVVEGEKNRKVVADFASLVPKRPPKEEGEATKPPPPSEKHVPVVAYVLGGVGIAALGSFALFAIQGRGEENDLAGTCAPNCTNDDLGPMRRDYLVADVSAGVGIVAIAVAVVLALPALSSTSSSTSASWRSWGTF